MKKKLTPCPECGQPVSRSAAVCPHCGFDLKKKRERGGCLMVLVIFGVVSWLVYQALDSTAAAEQTGPVTPEQERRQAIAGQFSSWDGSHRALVRRVKDALHDPGSFSHVRTSWLEAPEEMLLLTMEYRAKNSFGGTVLAEIQAIVDLNGNVIRIVQP